MSPLQGYGHPTDFNAALAMAAISSTSTLPSSMSSSSSSSGGMTLTPMKNIPNELLSSSSASRSPALPRALASPPLKEQERILDESKRENFSLRLKIYYLEERLKKAIPKNIEEALQEVSTSLGHYCPLYVQIHTKSYLFTYTAIHIHINIRIVDVFTTLHYTRIFIYLNAICFSNFKFPFMHCMYIICRSIKVMVGHFLFTLVCRM